MGSDGVDVICCTRLFQIRTAATGKAQSPYVESRVRKEETRNLAIANTARVSCAHKVTIHDVGHRNDV